MPLYQKTDDFIQNDLGGAPGVYDSFALRLGNHLTAIGDPWADYPSFLLQEHKKAMGRGRTKFDLYCIRRGPYAPWRVCLPGDAPSAITVKLDQLTMDMAYDFRCRAVKIAKAGNTSQKTAVRSRLMSEIGVLNGLRSMEGLPLIDPINVLALL